MNVAIRRVSLASLGKFGCLLGVVAAFLPSLLCGLAGLGRGLSTPGSARSRAGPGHRFIGSKEMESRL